MCSRFVCDTTGTLPHNRLDIWILAIIYSTVRGILTPLVPSTTVAFHSPRVPANSIGFNRKARLQHNVGNCRCEMTAHCSRPKCSARTDRITKGREENAVVRPHLKFSMTAWMLKIRCAWPPDALAQRLRGYEVCISPARRLKQTQTRWLLDNKIWHPRAS